MGIFNSNYSKPGPGVDKNAPPKKGLNLFYEIFFRKFWDIIKLNLLYALTLLPTFAILVILSGTITNSFSEAYGGIIAQVLGMEAPDIQNPEFSQMLIIFDLFFRITLSMAFIIFVGGGPMTAGFIYILKCFINEVPVFLVSDYFKAVKQNLKQSFPLWILDVIIFLGAYYAVLFYGRLSPPMMYLKYVVYLLIFFFTILHFYIYHIMVSYKMPFYQLYRNAALFAIPSFPFCLLAFAACVFIFAIFPAIAITAQSEALMNIFGFATVVVWVFFVFGVCGMIIEFNACTQIKKYIKEDPGVEEKEIIHSR